MTRSRVFSSGRVVFVCALALAAGLYLNRGWFTAESPHRRLGKVLREDLVQRVTIAGTAESQRTTVITAPYDGYVKRLFVKVGQPVLAGHPIVSFAQSLQTLEQTFPIRSPISGTVTQILKSEGQFAKNNDTKDFVVRLDDMRRMYINGSAPEIDVAKIKVGLEAVIKVSAILSKNYRGVVREVSLAASPAKDAWASRSQVEYLVKIEIVDADEQLKPGMTAVVDIVTQRRDNVLTLAHEFIAKEGENYFVRLKNGTKQQIRVGLQNESAFEVVDGLGEQQEVRQVDFLEVGGGL